jgi:hypothetical protein
MHGQDNFEFALILARTILWFRLVECWQATNFLPFFSEGDQAITTGWDNAEVKSPLLVEYGREKDFAF